MANVAPTLKRWLIHGVAITIPLVVTLIVLSVVLEFVLGVLSPVVDAVAYVWSDEPPTGVIQAATLASLVGSILLVGFVADQTSGERTSRAINGAIESIPVVSTLYASVRRASDVLLDDDTDQFQDVKLVAFPHEDSYMLAFLTADTPETIERAMGADEMRTVMIPLGPNPTTNGFVMHVPADRVHDVDLTVEEAIRSIATLGIDTRRED